LPNGPHTFASTPLSDALLGDAEEHRHVGERVLLPFDKLNEGRAQFGVLTERW
jgi:hypothetical protein